MFRTKQTNFKSNVTCDFIAVRSSKVSFLGLKVGPLSVGHGASVNQNGGGRRSHSTASDSL